MNGVIAATSLLLDTPLSRELSSSATALFDIECRQNPKSSCLASFEHRAKPCCESSMTFSTVRCSAVCFVAERCDCSTGSKLEAGGVALVAEQFNLRQCIEGSLDVISVSAFACMRLLC